MAIQQELRSASDFKVALTGGQLYFEDPKSTTRRLYSVPVGAANTFTLGASVPIVWGPATSVGLNIKNNAGVLEVWKGDESTKATIDVLGVTAAGPCSLGATAGDKVGFHGTTAIAKQTGVAVSAAGIHAALVALGLIGA